MAKDPALRFATAGELADAAVAALVSPAAEVTQPTALEEEFWPWESAAEPLRPGGVPPPERLPRPYRPRSVRFLRAADWTALAFLAFIALGYVFGAVIVDANIFALIAVPLAFGSALLRGAADRGVQAWTYVVSALAAISVVALWAISELLGTTSWAVVATTMYAVGLVFLAAARTLPAVSFYPTLAQDCHTVTDILMATGSAILTVSAVTVMGSTVGTAEVVLAAAVAILFLSARVLARPSRKFAVELIPAASAGLLAGIFIVLVVRRISSGAALGDVVVISLTAVLTLLPLALWLAAARCRVVERGRRQHPAA